MSLNTWLAALVPSRRSARKTRRTRLGLDILEDRLAPAVQLLYGGPGTTLSLNELAPGVVHNTVSISDNGTTTLTISLSSGTFDPSSTTAPTVTYSNPTPQTSTSATVDITNQGTLNLHANLTGDALNLGEIANSNGGINEINASAATITAGSLVSTTNTLSTTGDIVLDAAQSLALTPGASFQAATGNIVLKGNVDGASQTGSFTGVDLNDAKVQTTGQGDIDIEGRGGDSGGGTSGNNGVGVRGGSLVRSLGTGTVTLVGTGGQGLNDNIGVDITDANTLVGSATGNVIVTGTGGQGLGNDNVGVAVVNSATVSSTGTAANAATLSITGAGGQGTDDNTGVEVGASALVTSVLGAINLTGTGGDGSTTSNFGVTVFGGSSVSATDAAPITLTGTAGTGTGSDDGVLITGTNTPLVGAGGTVLVRGFGGPTGNALLVTNSAVVNNTGTGTVTLQADRDAVISAGATVSSADGGLTIQGNQGPAPAAGDFTGVEVNGSTVSTSGAGPILIQGRGGDDTATGNHYGIWVHAGGVVQSSGTGTLTLTGAGGLGTLFNAGVVLTDTGTKVTSATGDIAITGQGGNGSGNANIGVAVVTSATVSSTGTALGAATITVTGIGGQGTDDNIGVEAGNSAQVTSVVGAITITGTGGNGSSNNNYGVVTFGGAQVTSTGTTGGAPITITGTGGVGTDHSAGVRVQDSGTLITSVTGAIAITGHGNGTTFDNDGVQVLGQAQVTSTGTGADGATITLTGTGGHGTNNDDGVFLGNAGTLVTSVAGAIRITGTGGGNGTDNFNEGVLINQAVVLSSTGTGANAATITITGTGGSGTAGDFGVDLEDSGSAVTSVAGAVTITGTAGTGTSTQGISLLTSSQVATTSAPITLLGDSMALDPTASIDAPGNVVTLEPLTPGTQINLGGANAPGTLGLSAAALSDVTASVLRVGNQTTGLLTVSGAIAPAHVGTLSLINNGPVTETGTLTVNNLRVSSLGPVSLAQGNSVGTLAAQVSGAGNFTFTNSAALAIGTADGLAGITTADGDVTVTTTAGDLSLAQAISAGTGTVALTAGGAILNAAGAGNDVTAGQLALTAGTNIGTTAANGAINTAVATVAAFARNGGVSIANTGDLTLGPVGALNGVTATGGAIGIVTTGALTLPAGSGVRDSSGPVTLTAGTSNTPVVITLDGLLTGSPVNIFGGDANDTFNVNLAAGSSPAVTVTAVPAGSPASDNDVFNVTPGSGTTYTINGSDGSPSTEASPGDTLNINLAGTSGAALNGVTQSGDDFSGNYTFTNRSPVNFTTMDVLNPPDDVTTTAASASATFNPASQTVSLSAAVKDSSNPAVTVNEGTVTFTVVDSKNNPVGTAVQGKVSSGSASATFTLPADQAAGSYTILVSYTDVAGHFTEHTDTSNTLTVSPYAFSYTIGNDSQTYGSAANLTADLPSTIAALGGETLDISYSSAGDTATAGVNTYAITGTLSDGTGKVSNYNVTLNPGTLTVNPAPLTITANNQSKTYGQTSPFAGTEFTTSGLLNGDAVTSVTLSSAGAAATATVSGSPYAITASAAVGSGLGNYSITYKTGSLTVNAAQLTVTATDESKTYGQTFTFAGTEFTTSGLLNSDKVTSVTLTSPGAAATAAVSASPYAITASAAQGSGLGNYNITYNTGQLAVNPAGLIITANDLSKTYGQNLTFAGTEFTTNGLLNSDKVTSVTLSSAGAAATAGVSGSPYTITASAAVGSGLGNYNVTYDTGKLTVSPAALTITANNQSKTYGQSFIFAGTEFTTNGLLNSDTVSSVTLASSGSNPSASVSGSPYPITGSAATGTGLGNYTITYANGTFTVTAASVSTTAGDVLTAFSPTAQNVLLLANVTPAGQPGAALSTGTVLFTVQDGSQNTIGSPVQGVVINGSASTPFTVPAGQAAGHYTILVHYSDSSGNFTDKGDTNGTLVIAPIPTPTPTPTPPPSPRSTTISGTGAGAGATMPPASLAIHFPTATGTLSLSAHVGSPDSGVHQGIVTFVAANQTVSAKVDASGNATASVSLPGLGLFNLEKVAISYFDPSGEFLSSTDVEWVYTGLLDTMQTFTIVFDTNRDAVSVSSPGLFSVTFGLGGPSGLLIQLALGGFQVTSP
jgi:hypothetical protein